MAWRVAWAGLASVALAGCQAAEPLPPRTMGVPLLRQPVTASEGGVEWRVLTVAVSPERLAEALAPWSDDGAPLSRDLRVLWLGSGIRTLCVPSDQIASIQEQLAVPATAGEAGRAASLSRMAIDPGPRWVEALRDAGSEVPRVMALADARQPMEPGVVRLLARCWPEPRLSDDGRLDAVVRLELLPAWVDRAAIRRPRATDELAGATSVRGLDQQGVAIQRMLAGVSLESGQTLVLIHDLPRSTTTIGPRAESTADNGTGGGETGSATIPGLGEVQRGGRPFTNAAPADPVVDAVAGPQPPRGVGFRTTTLGEMLLTVGHVEPGESGAADSASGNHGPPVRRLIVFATPRVPARVSFIAP